MLLTISDHITRHALRRRNTPIVGAILGQQIGRQITLEHAFECNMIPDPNGGYRFDEAWFVDRLQQYKDVHKYPQLDLTGWFATCPASGILEEHARYQQQMEVHNESVLFLAFEPTAILQGRTTGGRLPFIVYESVYETVTEQKDKDAMVIDGQSQSGLQAKFRELPYSVETGEAEMISVDSVAKGGGNAMAIGNQVKDPGKGRATPTSVGEEQSLEQGGRGNENGVSAQEDTSYLSPEDDEREYTSLNRPIWLRINDIILVITSLTTRANAIKMLQARLSLLKAHLISLPSCYLNDPDKAHISKDDIDHSVLRSIQSLVARLPLLLPPDRAAFTSERLTEQHDVTLVRLLGEMGKSVRDAQELGRKFEALNRVKQEKKRGGAGGFKQETEDGFGDEAIDLVN